MALAAALVAVDQTVYHFDKPFTYFIPEDLRDKAKAGCRVLVPFGNGNKKRQGLILEISSVDGPEKIKPISGVLDDTPVLNDEMRRLVSWISETTFCTLFDAVRLLLPVGASLKIVDEYTLSPQKDLPLENLNEEEKKLLLLWNHRVQPLSFQKIWELMGKDFDAKVLEGLVQKQVLVKKEDAIQKISDASVKMARLSDGWEELQKGTTLTAKQKSVVELLKEVGSASVKEIGYFLGITPAVVQALCKKKLIKLYDKEIYRNPYAGVEKTVQESEICLTREQQEVYYGLEKQLSTGGVALLYGVTGSGKTSVFLKLIQRVVSEGKNVIVMVPEISLTPQLLDLFHRNFGGNIAVFHSGLSMGERLDEWKRVKNGDAHIVIGTRSAVFAPVENLGLIVMDEEQEYTYKSDSSPRFHARDIAKFRCGYHHALLLLCSATPSMESFYAAKAGRYQFYQLKSRYGPARLPQVEVVDMKEELRNGNRSSFSSVLLEGLEKNLKEKKQSILLMNRRGYHTFLSCKACGAVMVCPHCSISLTYHAANQRLMCHYCGYSVPLTEECPQCHKREVKFAGAGTQRAEEELMELFPEARILRMDADTTMAKFSHEEKFQDFAQGNYDIMIGTQMVAKGLDFENVTLVGVLSADQALYSDDFRSYERAFSLLTQVVGRSGRGSAPGKAVIQTTTPENPLICLASSQDYDKFYEGEIGLRKLRLYPPFADLCVIGFVGQEEGRVEQGAKKFLQLFTQVAAQKYPQLPLRVIGPTQAEVFKINNKFRYKLLIKCRNGRMFRAMLAEILKLFGKDRSVSDVTAYADMNPDMIL